MSELLEIYDCIDKLQECIDSGAYFIKEDDIYYLKLNYNLIDYEIVILSQGKSICELLINLGEE